MSAADSTGVSSEQADLPWYTGILCVGLLFLLLFGAVLFQDRNFVYRDAGHFYYPFFRRVAQEWSAGRVPLWNPDENGGEPLLANPTASVFYPLKLLYILPSGLAYKLYLLAHLPLAAWTTYVAARGWGQSRAGATFAALTYAFSGFVIFQLYNVVFLCGAAWLPLALWAGDSLVRAPRTGWAILLAVTLSLQVLGGDPQIAYLTVLALIPYAFLYHGGRHGAWWLFLLWLLGMAWVQASWLLPNMLREGHRAEWWWGLSKQPRAITVGLSLLFFIVAFCCSRPRWRLRQIVISRIVFALLLAQVLTLVQVWPTRELVAVSDRAAPKAPHETVAFSLFPARVMECFIPNFFGKQLPINTRWAPFSTYESGVWIPHLYMGLMPAVLGLGACGLVRANSTRRWLTVILLLAFWLGLGKFGGVGWWFDPLTGQPIDYSRVGRDVRRYGASDGIYWIAEETIPGFRSFRYPSKFLVFCTFCLAIFSGWGFESRGRGNAIAESTRGMGWLWDAITILGLCSLAGVFFFQASFISWISTGIPRATSFGPLTGASAWSDLAASVLHFALVALAISMVQRLPWWRGRIALFLIVVMVDLFLAQRWLVLTDVQTVLDAKPALLEKIEAAERALPAEKASTPAENSPSSPLSPHDGTAPSKRIESLYRIHRVAIWDLIHWDESISPRRIEEMNRWERDTLQPKYGLPFQMSYTQTIGTMSVYDVQFYFSAFPVRTPAVMAGKLPPTIIYYTRRGFDVWNTKYFILPRLPNWNDEHRGFFTFLTDAQGQLCPIIAESDPDKQDYLVLRNPDVFPRAWIVHTAEVRPPLRGMERIDREPIMERLLYRPLDGGLPLWPGPPRPEFLFRERVLLEYEGSFDLTPYSPQTRPAANETVTVEQYLPDRVLLGVDAESAGFLVLADTYYSGWSATVNNQPVPLLRANRAMRAVPIPAGKSMVEMRYRCWRFEVGALVSILGWLAVIIWTAHFVYTRRLTGSPPSE